MTIIPDELRLTPEEKRAIKVGINVPGYASGEQKLREIQKLLTDEWYVATRNRLISGAVEAANQVLKKDRYAKFPREFHREMTIRAKKAKLTSWSL